MVTVNHDCNANAVTHYLDGTLKQIQRAVRSIQELLPNAEVTLRKVALVSVLGSNIDTAKILRAALEALDDKKITLLALHQGLRQIDVQFVLEEDCYQPALEALHDRLIQGEEVRSIAEEKPSLESNIVNTMKFPANLAQWKSIDEEM